MTQRLLAALFVVLLGVSALGADTYFCPMKCEGEKIYAKRGACPVCGMALEGKTEGARPLNTREYRVDLVTTPAEPAKGEKSVLVLTPRSTKDNATLKLDVVHEKSMHLILVSQNLSSFQHLHPELLHDGSYRIETTFEQGGNHIAYVDITPTGDRNQVFPIAVKVNGKAAAVALKDTTRQTMKLPGDYSVTLKTSPRAKAEVPVTLTYRISKAGRPVTDLGKYLGENGHLVLISGDTTRYVHAHPPGGHSHHHEASPAVGKAVSTGPEVAFIASFPIKGIYASWMQFSHQGKVHTVPFVLDVR